MAIQAGLVVLPSIRVFRLSLSAHFVTKAYQVVKGIIDDYHDDALVKVLESIDHFLNRHEIYTMSPTINYE